METEASRSFDFGNAVVLGLMAIIVTVIAWYGSTFALNVSNFVMKPVNHILTHQGVCSHGYENRCNPHKMKGH